MKLFKKIISVLLAAMIMTLMFVPAVYAEDDGEKDVIIQGDVEAPVFVLRSSKVHEMWAGTRAAVPFALTKKRGAQFTRVLINVTGGASDVVADDSDIYMTDVEKGTTFIVTAGETAIAKNYEFNVHAIVYGMNNDVIAAQDFKVEVKVKSNLDSKGLKIETYTVDKEPIHPGDRFTLSVVLRNNSGINVKNAEVQITDLDNSKFVLDKGFSKQYVDIKDGQTGKVTFALIAQKGISLEREPLTVTLTYTLDEKKEEYKRTVSTQAIVKCAPEASEAKYGAHDLSMVNYTVSSSLVSKGTKFSVGVDLKNSGTMDISKARVSVNTDGNKFSVEKGLAYSDFSIKKGETKHFTFNLIGGAGIAFEREYLPIVIEFGANSSTEQVIVTCKPEGEKQDVGKYDLTVTSYSTSVETVAENSVFDLTFSVTNSGKKRIENARVTVTGLDGSKFAIDKGLPYSDFDINAGETKSFTFGLVGCKGIASIREVIPVEINYGEVTSTSNITVKCMPKETNGTDGDGKKVFAPNIIIESYNYGGEFATAGKQFPLTLTIRNVSSQAVIENLKVTINGKPLQDGSIAYSPANSSNSFFFESLGMKETKTINMDLLPKADAVPNSYPVLISFTYEYSVNKERYQASEITETITIPLRQEDRLEINEPEIPTWGINVGEMCTINISLVNKGKSDVYNVTAKVEGDGFTVESPTYYIGNIKSGVEEYYDAKITPVEEGTISGEIIFTYEDSNGESKESRTPFSLDAMSMGMGMDMGMGFDSDMMGMDEMPPEEGAGIMPFIIIGICAAVVVAVIIIVIVVVRKKKKKAELEDDDEDI